MTSKINLMLQKWPAGTVATQTWLEQLDIDKELTRRYRKSHWIESVGQGAFKRTGDIIHWQGGLYALQQIKCNVWPGGVSALALHGLVHYLPLGKERLWVFGTPGKVLPKWFKEYGWGVELVYQAPHLFDEVNCDTFVAWSAGSFAIQISTPERAAMELLLGVPERVGFEYAAEVFQGMATLRPRQVQALLESCRSVKVKRLFLFFADYYGHSWLNRLDLSRIDLGAGKRQIVQGGRMNKQFQITVPEAYADADE